MGPEQENDRSKLSKDDSSLTGEIGPKGALPEASKVEMSKFFAHFSFDYPKDLIKLVEIYQIAKIFQSTLPHMRSLAATHVTMGLIGVTTKRLGEVVRDLSPTDQIKCEHIFGKAPIIEPPFGYAGTCPYEGDRTEIRTARHIYRSMHNELFKMVEDQLNNLPTDTRASLVSRDICLAPELPKELAEELSRFLDQVGEYDPKLWQKPSKTTPAITSRPAKPITEMNKDHNLETVDYSTRTAQKPIATESIYERAQKISDSKKITDADKKVILAYHPTEEDMIMAQKMVSRGYVMAGLVVDQEAEKLDIEMAAKIIGAIPASRIPCQVGFTHPQPLWLLTESYLLQNKDTTPIHAGAMENRGKNKDRGEILNDILKGLLPDYF